MRRREFIALVGGAAATWPLAARAQQLPVIGILSSRSRATDALLIAVIRQGLNDTGFIEGRNVSIEYRWAEGNYGRLADRLHDWLLRIMGALTAPTFMALACRWRSRPQHQDRTYAVQQRDASFDHHRSFGFSPLRSAAGGNEVAVGVGRAGTRCWTVSVLIKIAMN
jgi:hypothetical protein